jgi:hypothetical protein
MFTILDRWHTGARRSAVIHRLVIVSRILLALGFIPTAMVKLLGQRFTLMPVSTPVGAIFDAFYQTGAYWRFLGLGQVVAGLLLLVPSTAVLGAVAFFPIILNVTILTWAVHFQGTPMITAAMLLANLLLLAWDYHRWRSILTLQPVALVAHRRFKTPVIERAGYAFGTTAGLVFLLGTRSFVSSALMFGAIPVSIVAGVLVLIGWWQTSRAE